MFRKGLAFLLAIILLMSITACGDSDEGKDEAKDNTKITGEGRPVTTRLPQGNQPTVPNPSSSNNSTSNNSSVELPQEKINEAMFIAGTPDGYAVVGYNPNDDGPMVGYDDTYYCVNGRGEIQGQIDIDSSYVRPYAKPSPTGYVLVDTDDGLAVVDRTGKLMFSEASLGVTGFTKPKKESTLWYEYVVPSMQDDYLMAYKVEETYDSVTYSVGVVNMQGEWVVPLSADHPIVKETDCWNEGGLEQLVYYAGSGVFTYCTRAGYLSIYNVKTNKSTQIEMKTAEIFLTDEYKQFRFVDGRMVWRDVYMQATYYRSIDADGNYVQFLTADGSGSTVQHSKTYMINESYFWIGEELWDRSTLTKVAKKDYNLYYETEYVGGYKPVLIENQAGSIYFGLENADGYKFEPVKVDHSNYNVTLYEDGTYVLCVEWKNGNHNVGYLYDYNGNRLNVAQGDLYAGMQMRNGIIRTKDDNDMVYHKATDKIDYWL